MPPRSKSPAAKSARSRSPSEKAVRSKSPATKRTQPKRATSRADQKKASGAGVEGTPSAASSAVPPEAAPKQSGDFYQSVRIYLCCVGTLGLVMAVLMRIRPDAPPKVCDAMGPSLLLQISTESVQTVWGCTKAYQEKNWWFVLAVFETLYIGIKMLAIPATFTLCVLAGALFPFPLCQVVTGVAEATGSSLCYLLSQAFLEPIVEYFFASKLEMMKKKADEEKQYMLSFNFFLRLTPFMPNWMINLSCPLVGVPLQPFFIGSLFGTQLSLLFLAISGATLREAGETGFDLAKVKNQLKYMGVVMGVLQLVPIAFVWFQKRRAAAKTD